MSFLPLFFFAWLTVFALFGKREFFLHADLSVQKENRDQRHDTTTAVRTTSRPASIR